MPILEKYGSRPASGSEGKDRRQRFEDGESEIFALQMARKGMFFTLQRQKMQVEGDVNFQVRIDAPNAGDRARQEAGIIALLQIEHISQEIDERLVGDVPAVGLASPLQNSDARIVFEKALEFQQQPALAHSRFTDNRHILPFSCSRFVIDSLK